MTRYPFLRIFFVFACGILASRNNNLAQIIPTNLHLIISLFVVAIIGKLLFKQLSNAIWGWLLLLTVFFIGFFKYQATNRAIEKSTIQATWQKSNTYIGVISSYPINKPKFIIHEVDIKVGIQDTATIDIPTRILLYEKKITHYPSTLQYGDKIRVNGHPSGIPAAKNPYEFDFSEYMAEKNIYLQQFVDPDQIQLISKYNSNSLMSAVYQIRSNFEQKISSSIKGENEQAIVLALLLGIKGQLDPEIKSAYATAGAMHVLAVSGLHVSIIYFILTWLFKLLPAGDLKRFVTPMISIILLWIYALLTGFSPSILRAVTMFSVIIFSEILNRQTHVFNSLAFAAFSLLFIDPSFLFAIGFQLSFLAVAGIVYIYPKLYNLWAINNWLGDKIWQLTCVSIAAQIATFPVSLYYFNQFPTYFLLTNLVVIPGAFVIMIGGIGLLVFDSWADWAGVFLEKLVLAMNVFVEAIQNLEGSVLDWIYISPLQLCLVYLFILAFFALLHVKKSFYIPIMIISVLGIGTDQSQRLISQSNNKSLLFYSAGRFRLIDKIDRFRAKLYTLDSAVNHAKQLWHVNPFRVRHQLPKPKNIELIDGQLSEFAKMMVLNQKRVINFARPFDPNEIQFQLHADIAVISNQSIESLDKLKQIVACNQIILDNTNTLAYIKKFKLEGKNSEMQIVDLKNQAFMISLSRNKKFLDMFF